jgi:hypothetical protein
MIRNATFSDIPAIVSFLQLTYLRTHYAMSGLAEIDVPETKRLLMNGIQRHGGKHGGACWVQVSDNGAAIDGLMLGTLARVYSIFNRLMVTDLFWVTSEEADARAAIGLMRGMLDWAKTCPLVIEAHCGTTAIINGDPGKAGKILEHLGMKTYGNIYRMEFAP